MADISFGRGVVELIGDDSKLKSVMDRATKDVISKADQMQQQMNTKLRNIGLGLMSVGTGMVAAAANMTTTAARTEVLGISLEVVGRTAQKTKQELAELEAGIKSKGITTQEARSSLIKFMQSEIDVGKAADLARVAQDLAVIAANNSSEAFGDLTQAIAAQRPILLRQYGIVMELNQIYEMMGKTLGIYKTQVDSSGRTTGSWLRELTEVEKKTAFLNIILEKGAKVAGVYENAMNAAGKRLTSLPRLIEELKNSIGEALLPTMLAGIKALEVVLKFITALPEPVRHAIGYFLGFGGAIAIVSGALTLMAKSALAQLIVSLWQSVQAAAASQASMAALGVQLTSTNALMTVLAAKAHVMWAAITGPAALAIAAIGAAVGVFLLVKKHQDEYNASLNVMATEAAEKYRSMADSAGEYGNKIIELGTQIEHTRLRMQNMGGEGSLEYDIMADKIRNLQAEMEKYLELAEKAAYFKMFADAEKDIENVGTRWKTMIEGVREDMNRAAEEAERFKPIMSKINEALAAGYGDLLALRADFARKSQETDLSYERDTIQAQRQYSVDRMVLLRDANARIAAMRAAGRNEDADNEQRQLDYSVRQLDGNYRHEQAMLKWNLQVKKTEQQLAYAEELQALRNQMMAKAIIESTSSVDGLRRLAANYGMQGDMAIRAAMYERQLAEWEAENLSLRLENHEQYTIEKQKQIQILINANFGYMQSTKDLQDTLDALYANVPINLPPPPPLPDFGGAAAGAQQTETAVEALEDTVSKAASAINAAFEMFDKLAGFVHRDYKAKLEQFSEDVVGVIVAMVHAAWKLGDASHDWHDFVKAAGEFADGAGKAVGLVSQGVQAFAALRTYKGVSAEAIAQIANDILAATKEIVRVSDKVNKEALTAAMSFSTGAGSVMELMTKAIDSLGRLYAFRARPLPTARLGAIVDSVREVVTAFSKLGDLDAAPLTDSLDAVSGVVSVAGNLVDSLQKIQDFRPVLQRLGPEKIEFIVTQAGKIYDVLARSFSGMAEAGDDIAEARGRLGDTIDHVVGAISQLKTIVETLEAVQKFEFKGDVGYRKLEMIARVTQNSLSVLWNTFKSLLSKEGEDWLAWQAGGVFAETIEAVSSAVGQLKAIVETLEAVQEFDFGDASYPKLEMIARVTQNSLSVLWNTFASLLSKDEAGDWQSWGAGGVFASTIASVTDAVSQLKTIVETLDAVQEFEFNGDTGYRKLEMIARVTGNMLSVLWTTFSNLITMAEGEWQQWAAGGVFATTVSNVAEAVSILKNIVETLDAVQNFTFSGDTGYKKLEQIARVASNMLSVLWTTFASLLSKDEEGDWQEWAAGGAFETTAGYIASAIGQLKSIVDTLDAVQEFKFTGDVGYSKIAMIARVAQNSLSVLWSTFSSLLSKDEAGDWQSWAQGGAFASTIKSVTDAISGLKTIIDTLQAVQTFKIIPAASSRAKVEQIVNASREMLSALWAGWQHLISKDEEDEWQQWAAGGAFSETVQAVSTAIEQLGSFVETLDAVQRFRYTGKATRSKMEQIISGAKEALSVLWDGFQHLISKDELGVWQEWGAGGAFSSTLQNVASAIGTLKTFMDVLDAAGNWRAKSTSTGVIAIVLENTKMVLRMMENAFAELIVWKEGQPEVWGTEFAATMDNVSRSITAVGEMLEVVDKLSRWRPASLEESKIRVLVTNIKYIVDTFYDTFKEVIDKDTDDSYDARLSEVAEHWAAAIGTVKTMIDVGASLANYRAPSTASIDSIVEDMEKLVTKLAQKAKDLEATVDFELTGEFADIVQKVGSAINSLLDPFTGLNVYVPIDTATIDNFASNVAYMVDALGEAAESVTPERVASAQLLAESFGAIGQALESSANALEAVMHAGWARVYEKIGNLVADMVEAIVYLSEKDQWLKQQKIDVEGAGKLAAIIGTVGSALSAAVDAYGKIYFWKADVAATENAKAFVGVFADIAAELALAYNDAVETGNFAKAQKYLAWADMIGQLMRRAFDTLVSMTYGQYDWGRYKALGRAIMIGISEGIDESLGYIQASLERMAAMVVDYCGDMGYNAGQMFIEQLLLAVRERIGELGELINPSGYMSGANVAAGGLVGANMGSMVTVSVPVTIAGNVLGRSGLDEVVEMISGGVVRIVNTELGRLGIVVR